MKRNVLPKCSLVLAPCWARRRGSRARRHDRGQAHSAPAAAAGSTKRRPGDLARAYRAACGSAAACATWRSARRHSACPMLERSSPTRRRRCGARESARGRDRGCIPRGFADDLQEDRCRVSSEHWARCASADTADVLEYPDRPVLPACSCRARRSALVRGREYNRTLVCGRASPTADVRGCHALERWLRRIPASAWRRPPRSRGLPGALN
jgi:hypothetical protein